MSNKHDFDIAFAIFTGHVDKVNWSDYPQYVIKQSSDIALWGPESRLLSKVLISAYNKYISPYIKEIQKAFIINDDIKINKKKLNKALKGSKNAGSKIVKDKKVMTKVKVILKAGSNRSLRYFVSQSKKVKKADVGFDEFIAASLSDHVVAFTEKYPERILHPEIERLVNIIETDPTSRTIDKHAIAYRLETLNKFGENYFENLADVQVGRAWSYTGLELAYQNNVTTYQIVAQIDDPNKPCVECQILHGQTFDVVTAREKMLEVLEEKDPDKIKELAPFPRRDELIKPDMTPEKISQQGYIPPFHNSCRCDIVMLGTETFTETIKTPQELKIEELSNEIRNLKHERLYAVDKNGNIVLKKDGGKSEIKFTDKESILTQNTIIIHNHPGGNAFSKEDISFLLSNNGNEIRAISTSYDYFMEIDKDYYNLKTAINRKEILENKDFMEKFTKTRLKIDDIENNIRKEFMDKIRKKEMTIGDANFLHHHELWTRISKENLGLIYKRIKIK